MMLGLISPQNIEYLCMKTNWGHSRSRYTRLGFFRLEVRGISMYENGLNVRPLIQNNNIAFAAQQFFKKMKAHKASMQKIMDVLLCCVDWWWENVIFRKKRYLFCVRQIGNHKIKPHHIWQHHRVVWVIWLGAQFADQIVLMDVGSRLWEQIGAWFGTE